VKERIAERIREGSSVTSEAKELEIYDIVKKEFDESRIELDKTKGLRIKRIAYSTETYVFKLHGVKDEVTEMIEKNVLGALIKRFKIK